MTTVRTAARPYAFTFAEFATGALCAWAVYLLIGGLLQTLVFTVYAAVVLLPASIAALVLGAPFACLLGLALARVSRRWVHIGAFAALGFVIGIGVTPAALLIAYPTLPNGSGLIVGLALANGVFAAIALALGRNGAVKRASAADLAARAKTDDLETPAHPPRSGAEPWSP